MIIRGLLGFTLLLGGALSIYAQVSVSARLEKDEALIGDHLPLQLTVSHPEGAQISRVELAWPDSLGIEVLEESALMRINETLVQKNALLTAFDSGYYRLPPLAVVYSRNGRTDTAFSSSLGFRLHTIPVPADSAILQPIKPIVEEPLRLEDFRTAGLVLALLLVFALIGWWLVRQYRRSLADQPEEVVYEAVHLGAIRALDRLREKAAWREMDLKTYYSTVTRILRQYVEFRFHLSALESTTVELEALLSGKKELARTEREALLDLLREADLVKFAKSRPAAAERQALLEKAREWVTKTADELVRRPVVENDPYL